MTDAAEFQRRQLYDPAAPTAADRLALLRWLEAQGATVDEMVAAFREGRLTALVADLVLRPGPRFDLRELAGRTGLGAEQIARIWRAAGFPPPAPGAGLFTADNVSTFATFRAAAAIFGEQAMLHFTRTLGNALATVAEAAVSMFLVNVQAHLMGEHPSELALAQADLEARQLLSGVPGFMESLFRVHAEEAIRRSRQTRITAGRHDTSRLAIGFVDLVGFTPLTQQLSTRELAGVVDEFEARAFDVAAERDGRVVKLIGDEVMFVAPTAAAGCEIALTLAEAFRERRGVTPRGGVAFGEVLTRGGDYYGTIVNVAARIAELAIPHEVLVTAEVEDAARAAGAPLAFAPAGRRMLKGFAEPVAVFAAARAPG